jgi:hypothetical protein
VSAHPPAIEGGRVPGGVVVRWYHPGGRLLRESLIVGTATDAGLSAVADRDWLELSRLHDGAELAAYDGDTGALMVAGWVGWLDVGSSRRSR